MAAFASRADDLSASIRLLAPTLANANAASRRSTRRSRRTRAFARDILPGRQRDAPRRSTRRFPWIAQTRKLLAAERARRPGEGPRARPRAASRLHRRVADSCCRRSTARRCASSDVILPTGDIVDPRRSSTPARRTTRSSGTRWSASPARARTSTATAPTSASSPAAASDTVARARPARPAGQARAATRRPRSLGTQPKFPRQAPAVQLDVPCYKKQRSRTSTGRPAPVGHEARGPREARDPQALARLRRDHRPDPDLGRRRDLHPRPPAPLRCRAGCPCRRQGLLRPQGRVHDRAGGHAGPGADGQHRRRPGRARSRTSSSRTARRS